MDTPETLIIEQVTNGFIVGKRRQNGEYGRAYESSPPQVFQSMSELIRCIEGHFTHRSSYVEADHNSLPTTIQP